MVFKHHPSLGSGNLHGNFASKHLGLGVQGEQVQLNFPVQTATAVLLQLFLTTVPRLHLHAPKFDGVGEMIGVGATVVVGVRLGLIVGEGEG